ncbi:MAG: glycosyltransferase [Lachnospiraceae bacterium]|nr:glycosyltransferase [Lachnospiraceae bacterium]
MRLSIIVPVYNMAEDNKLTFCIDSLLNQTITDYEIVAVDDKSTDNSAEILKKYESENPDRIKVILSDRNGRQGTAKNKGINVSQGEWIGFIDSDDWIAPDMYEKLLACAEATGADVVGCDFSLVNSHTFEVGKVVNNSRDNQSGILDSDKRKSLILDGGSLCVKIYKRDRILKEGLYFPEGIFYEDNAIGNAYLVTAHHFEYVKEPLYYYYQHDTSTVHTVSKARCKDRMAAAEFMMADAKKRGFYEELKEEIDFKFIMLYYLNTVFSYMRDGEDTDIGFLKELANGLKRNLPDFELNKYYLEKINSEERKLSKMHQKNTLMFVIYYRLLWFYRKLRKRK